MYKIKFNDGSERTYETLRCADLRSANLMDAILSGADMRGANLSGTRAFRANMSGADLRGANLEGANLSGANLTNANLSNAYLSNAYLSGANLSGADLRSAQLGFCDTPTQRFLLFKRACSPARLWVGGLELAAARKICKRRDWIAWLSNQGIRGVPKAFRAGKFAT